MSSNAQPIVWVDTASRLDGLPGESRRLGRYLYRLADHADGIVADSHPVDGLQLVRTTPTSPTRVQIKGVMLEGVKHSGAVGVKILEDKRLVDAPRRAQISDVCVS
jgi:hypothetical protein